MMLLAASAIGSACWCGNDPEARKGAAEIATSSSSPGSKSPVLSDFHGIELLADARHVYWTEVGVKEHDDEPVYLTRAAVKRLAHDGGAVEILFDFKRDGRRCTPRALSFLRDSVGWLCRQEWVKGPFDPTSYVHLRRGALHAVPLVDAGSKLIGSDYRDVFFVPSSGDEVARLDPVTGARARLTTIPSELRLVTGVAGTIPGAVVGRSRDKERDVVWSVPTDGGEMTEVASFPAPRVREVATGGERIVVSWGGYPVHTLTIVEDGRARTLLESGTPVSSLLLDGDQLYFHSAGRIQRVHLDTAAVTVLAGAPPLPSLAVGGGFLYWRQGNELRRHRL